jgi:glycosyltransferase involved in cell wall biosynthesis
MNCFPEVSSGLAKPGRRILFLLPSLNAGGTENYVLRFLRHQSKDYCFTIIIRDLQKGDLYSEYQDLPVNFLYKKIGYFDPLKWWSFHKFLKSGNFNAICDFNGNFAGIPLLMAKLAGIENRIAFYRRSSNAYKNTIVRKLYDNWVNALVFKYATKILSNSRAALDFFFPTRDLSDQRFKVILNGIESGEFYTKLTKFQARSLYGIPENGFVVGHVGRFDPSKNHTTIFEVASKLKQDFSNLYFVYCGRNTDSDEFRDQLKRRNIEDISTVLGLQKDLPAVFKTMDLFYFPSITEGQPNALIEAMISGLPIIASDIPSIREIIPDQLQEDVLIGPTDINTACKRIENYIAGTQPKFNLRNEICRKFDANVNFQIFFNEL